MSHSKSSALCLSLLLLSSCSIDFIPVHASRVKSAKYAEQPLLRGAQAPGAFKYSWTFEKPRGFLFDPTQIELVAGSMKLKLNPDGLGRKEAMFVAHGGPSFVALDSITATSAPGSQGEIRFQISPNDSAWYFYDRAKWVPAGPNSGQANTAEELNAGIGKFHSEIGSGELSLRAFLVSPSGKDNVALKSVTVQGISPRVDGWD